MYLKAIRPIKYGTLIAPGGVFFATEEDARQLLRIGVAIELPLPSVQYETKIVTPEVKGQAPEPFRQLPDADHGEPNQILAESDSMLAEPDLSEEGAAPRRRRGRPPKARP